MFSDNKDLYPTPKELAQKMLSKVDWVNVKTILEPSAGLGHLVEAIKDYDRFSKRYNISAIEIDNKCRNVLIGNGIDVIDSDFLLYSGLEQFDLIVANFPFSDGDKHLHKAIDILFSGQIVCLINAETLKNPYSNSRKELVQKLNKLDAKIEYIQNAFIDADRKTGVEVALIYINKIQDVETELFNDISQSEDDFDDIRENYEVATKDNLVNIVKRYNKDKEFVTNQIMDFYKNYTSISKYLNLSIVGLSDFEHENEKYLEKKSLTEIMKLKLNQFAKKLKKSYWTDAIELNEINERLTSKKKKELLSELNSYCNMDFTESNIKIFIENIIAKYPLMIEEAILYMFDDFTKYAFKDYWNQNDEYSQNIHMYNGWKTNQAYKINKKIILPFYVGWNGITSLSSEQQYFLDDIDLVFNYFDEKNIENELLQYKDIYRHCENMTKTKQTGEIVRYWLSQGFSKNIKTRYFTISVYKKGTMHFVFNDLDMLRKFNIYVAKKRGWLPMNYGYTAKKDDSVDFETAKEYKQYGQELAIQTPKFKMIT